MNRVLFCATVDFHFQKFHIPYLKWFKERGWEVHVAAFGEMPLPYVDQKFNIPIRRSPLSHNNLQAFKELKSIINQNHYQIIHCHTPMGGVLTRLAAREARKKGTKVIYTAHGFHFCRGAPPANWLLYYPIEKMLAHHTDCLITINQEDYQLAQDNRFGSGNIEQIHGVGVNIERFHPVDEARKQALRKEFGYKPDDFLMFYAAEFNKNKNQQFLIKALSLVKDEISNMRLLLAGDGMLQKACQKQAAQLGVDGMIDFLGYQDQIEPFLKQSDLAIASSLREGLPVNIMEAMASGLPVVANDNRGHRELIDNGENGWIVCNHKEMSARMKYLATHHDVGEKMGRVGREMIEKQFSIERILEEKSKIYSSLMDQLGELEWATQ